MMAFAAAARRETVRGLRLLRVVAHLASGALIAHGGFTLLRLARLDRDRAWRERIVGWWMRRLLHILRVRVVVDGVARARPALFVANHISWLDIPVLRAVLDCAFVSKQEVRTWPVVGGLAAHAGTVFLERGTPAALARAADQMTWSLRQGRSVVIFPEGTTTDGRSVQRFHARLYQAAILACATVQAVALRYPDGVDGRESHAAAPFVGDMDLARHLWRLAGEDRLVARLHFCAPVAAAGPRRALAEHTRGLILHALAPARAATHATPQAGTGANRG